MYNSMIAVIHKDSAGTIHAFGRGLTAAFHRLGLPAAMVTLKQNEEAVFHAFERLRAEGGTPFLFDVNGAIGSKDAAKFSWVVDHPLCHPRLASVGNRTVLGTIDRVHAQLTGYSPAPAVFVPHGGAEPDEQPRPWSERDIDVLFVGNVPPERKGLKPLEMFAYEAGAQAGRSGADPFAVLVAALAAHGLSLASFSREDAADLLSIATLESQRIERITALLSITSARLHVVGALYGTWPARLGANVTVHGGIDPFDEISDLMRRARVVINLSSKFPHGSHERIWQAMACGAAVITNHSSFVEQDFTQGEHIYYYKRPDEIGSLVDAALAGNAGARAAEAARPIYQASHTWDDRAARILGAMNRLVPSR